MEIFGPYKFMQFEQPSGIFLLTIIPAEELLRFYTIDRREYTGDTSQGTQRKLSSPRVDAISEYVRTVDASFPTSIILSAENGLYDLDLDSSEISFQDKVEVIDGQHRLEGLRKARDNNGGDIVKDYNLPCVVVLDATEEQKAFLFATINGEQQKVPKSVVYELFGVSTVDDPYKILHTVARRLNFSQDSPFYRRLKMLGSKSYDVDTESLTQGTFIRELVGMLSSNPLRDRNVIKTKGYNSLPNEPDRVLRQYLFEDGADYLYVLLKNIFTGVRNTWSDQWMDHRNFILSKTTGYIGIIKGVEDVLKHGLENENVTERFFQDFFTHVDRLLQEKGLQLTNASFPSGTVGQNKLRDIVKEAGVDYLG